MDNRPIGITEREPSDSIDVLRWKLDEANVAIWWLFIIGFFSLLANAILFPVVLWLIL